MNQIETIKYLRDKGAGVRMLDDVADYVGGYNSPLFIPTIEFMLKMRVALGIEKQVNQSVEVEVGGQEQEQLPEKYEPDYFKNISLEAAHDCAPSIENIESQQMNEMQNYLSDMIEQENNYMLQLEQEVEIKQEKIKDPKSQERKMAAQQKKAEKESMIQEIQETAKQKSQEHDANSPKNKKGNANQQAFIHNQNTDDIQRVTRQDSRRQQTIRKSIRSLLDTYLTRAEKRDLKNLAGVTKGKDSEKVEVAVQQTTQQTTQQQAQHQAQQQAQHQAQHQAQQQPQSQQLKQQQEVEVKQQPVRKQKNAMDALISAVIDKVVRSSKDKKIEIVTKPEEKAVQASKEPESTKHRDQVGKDNAPRADDKKVAEMSAKDAISKLRESGVKPVVQDAPVAPSVKDVMDKQTQEQLKKNEQVQR